MNFAIFKKVDLELIANDVQSCDVVIFFFVSVHTDCTLAFIQLVIDDSIFMTFYTNYSNITLLSY